MAAAIGIAAWLAAQPAAGHHSAAMFDEQKSVTLAGTVTGFQWTNPHCWIQLLVPGLSGSAEWSVEMGAPSQLFNRGWRPNILSAGEKITVVIHPMRDGSNGGVFVSGADADGNPLGNSSARKASPGT